jgi:hypothetical protein
MTVERALGIAISICILIVLVFLIVALAQGGFHLSIVN